MMDGPVGLILREGICQDRDLDLFGHAARPIGRDGADRTGVHVLHGVRGQFAVCIGGADRTVVQIDGDTGGGSAVPVQNGDHRAEAHHLGTGLQLIVRGERQGLAGQSGGALVAMAVLILDAADRVGEGVDGGVQGLINIEGDGGQGLGERLVQTLDADAGGIICGLKRQRQGCLLIPGGVILRVSVPTIGVGHRGFTDIGIQVAEGDGGVFDVFGGHDPQVILAAQGDELLALDGDRLRFDLGLRGIHNETAGLLRRVAECVIDADRQHVVAVGQIQADGGRVLGQVSILNGFPVDEDLGLLRSDAGLIGTVHIVELRHNLQIVLVQQSAAVRR